MHYIILTQMLKRYLPCVLPEVGTVSLQLNPWKPDVQLHLNVIPVTAHTPPFLHGLEKHVSAEKRTTNQP